MQLAKMRFDEIPDLTAELKSIFNFYFFLQQRLDMDSILRCRSLSNIKKKRWSTLTAQEFPQLHTSMTIGER